MIYAVGLLEGEKMSIQKTQNIDLLEKMRDELRKNLEATHNQLTALTAEDVASKSKTERILFERKIAELEKTMERLNAQLKELIAMDIERSAVRKYNSEHKIKNLM